MAIDLLICTLAIHQFCFHSHQINMVEAEALVLLFIKKKRLTQNKYLARRLISVWTAFGSVIFCFRSSWHDSGKKNPWSKTLQNGSINPYAKGILSDRD